VVPIDEQASDDELEKWKEQELEPTWDEKPEENMRPPQEKFMPTDLSGDLEDDAEDREELEEGREPLGEAFRKEKLGSFKEAATA
jgi:hypothetical protein